MDRVWQYRRIRAQKPDQSGGLYAALRFIVIALVILLFASFVLILATGVAGYSLYASYVNELPSAEEISQASTQSFETTRLYDSTGETVLYEIIATDEGNRSYVSLSDIPEALRYGTIASEDKTFYTNPGGLNIVGLGRAAWGVISGDYAGGGSSITQQLVRNVIMTYEERTDVNLGRKLQEMVLSVELTRRYPGTEGRDQILEWYLNNIEYGHMAVGVQAAAQTYFGKDVQDLSLAECAMLVPVGNSPALNPIDAFDEAKSRQEIVLDELYLQGYITAEEAYEAKQEEVVIIPATYDMIAPHYVLYVRDQLEEMFGSDAVYGGGLQVITAVDLDIQEKANEYAQQQIDEIGATYEATNAAVVVIDAQTGELKALVGSLDYDNDEIDGQVNMALSGRQPGSSFKPFVYATGFQQGYTAATMVMDVPTSFSDYPNLVPYTPENYSRTYHGPLLLRQALGCSYNIPAVWLAQQVGTDAVVDTARTMGITSLTDTTYGLSLALGSASVSLLDMTYAFSVFANNGVMVGTEVPESAQVEGLRTLNPACILEVRDAEGNLLYKYDEPTKKAVISSEVAFLVTDILSDNNARAQAFGVDNDLTLEDRPVAAKTGTTNDYHDAWTVGFTPQYVVGVWVGNSDYTEMKNASGVRVAAPIWNSLMTWLHEDLPVESFTRPPGIVTEVIDATSGKLPTENSSTLIQELFIEGTEPTEEDDVHQTYRICTESGKLATEYCPEESVIEVVYNVYPAEADDWVREEGIAQPPTEICDLHGPSLTNTPVAITAPAIFDTIQGIVEVTGNATADGFERYYLEYGEGMTPLSWARIGSEHGNTVGNGVLEYWDTTGLEGLYTLRLNVVASGQVKQFTSQVVVDNAVPEVVLLSPEADQEFEYVDDEWISFYVVVADNVSISKVEYYVDGQLVDYTTVAPFSIRVLLPKTAQEAEPVAEGEQAIVDPTALGEHSCYAIVYDAAGNSVESESVTYKVVSYNPYDDEDE